ncbi:tetratricopeptide repeat protein, partial [Xanthomonas sp. Kuri4-2]
MQDKIIEALRRHAADEAVALAREWVAAEGMEPRAHRWLGMALQQQGRLDEALASIDAALTLTPEDADFLVQFVVGQQHLDRQREGAEGGLDLAQAFLDALGDGISPSRV